MNTAKHWNGSNLRPLPKKRYRFWNRNFLPVMLVASLLGTILDLYFVERKFYQFPLRPFPDIFSFNIVYTFVVLPVFVLFYLRIMDQVNKWGKVGIILFLSLLMPILEKLAEVCGMFIHSNDWKHLYTFFGYFGFLLLLYIFYQWLEKQDR